MQESKREIDISETDNRKTDEEWLIILQEKVRNVPSYCGIRQSSVNKNP